MFSSSTFKHNTSLTLTLRSSLQLPKIIHATFWDLLFNFLLSLMIHSEISFPFNHSTIIYHFATLKESQKSFLRLSNSAPSLKLFSKIFFPIFYHSIVVDATPQDLPHAIEDMGGIWFAMVCHSVLSIRGGRGALWNTTYATCKLKKETPFQQNQFFQDASSAMYFHQHVARRHSQPLAATCSHSFGCKWL